MADDIDIEEHDILDNPRVKEILPDLDNIKTEPLDFVEGPTEDYEDGNYYEAYQEAEYEVPMEFEEQQDRMSDHYSTDSPDPERQYFNNKIILGSRPCQKTTITDLKDLVIQLEDWGERLNNSSCFCKECKTLFATRNALDAHNMSVHSFLVAMESPVHSDDNMAKLKTCNHCQTYFKDDNLLIQHLYELITAKQAKKNEGSAPFKSAAGSKVLPTNSSFLLLKCPVCDSCYKENGKLALHMYHNHGVHQYDPTPKVPFDPRCKICGNILASPITYNKHIIRSHADLFRKKVRTQPKVEQKEEVVKEDALSVPQQPGSGLVKYKCSKCVKNFPSLLTARRHRSLAHPGEIFPIKQVTPKTVVASKVKKLNKPLSVTHEYVPKKVLFKCEKCNLHFFTSVIALAHSARCNGVPDKVYKCEQCRKIFRLMDMKQHELQHSFVGKFRVYMMHNNIYARVLCRCPKCSVYFEERNFLRHCKVGCEVTLSTEHCNICKINVNNFPVHNLKHTKMKLLKSDFIVIDDFIVLKKTSTEMKVGEKRKLDEADAPAKKQKVEVLKRKAVLYYCKSCHAFGISKQRRNVHLSKQCRMYGNEKPCIVCGLTFSPGTLKNHLGLHMEKDLELKDFSFASIKTFRPITPLMPEFPNCVKCGVHYVSQMRHFCSDTIRTCGTCNKKFNELGYELHILHHKYIKKDDTQSLETSELIQKYQSYKVTWNILYNCKTCDVSTDSYDQVVEHCQKHYNNMESYDVTIRNCKNCSLQFEEECFKKHHELHLTRPIDRDSFKVLNYDYLQLLTDDWLKIFAALPKEEVGQILSKSMYSSVRSVKLQLLEEGPSDFMLFKCSTCEKCVEASAVHNHAKTPDCKKMKNFFRCSVCDIRFVSPIGRSKHEQTHTSNVNCNYRVVAFNSPLDKEFNSVLDAENRITKPLLGHTLPKPIAIAQSSATVAKEEPDMSKIVKIYKCSCGLHFTSPKTIEKHFAVCSPDNKISSENCSKCGYLFPTDLLVSHLCNHHSSGDIKIEVTTIPTVTLFRCGTCKCLFAIKAQLINHYRRCDGTNRGVTCGTCGLEFHRAAIAIHKEKHDKSLDKRPYRIVTMKSNSLIRNPNPDVYKCNRCNKHFLSLKEGRQHIRSNHTASIKHRQCKVCGLTFGYSSMAIHNLKHHIRQHLKASDLNIVSLDAPTPEAKDDTSRIRDMQKSEKRGVKDYKRLFRCEQCDLHYLSIAAVKSHFEVQHRFRNPQPCGTCGLKFTDTTMPRHEAMHHGYRKLTRDDLHIVTVNPIDVLTSSPSNNDTSTAVVNRAVPNIKKLTITNAKKNISPTTVVNIEKSHKLYKCKICGVHFSKNISLIEHLKLGKHSLKSVAQCSFCDLLFTKKALHCHMQFYHKTPNRFSFLVMEYDNPDLVDKEGRDDSSPVVAQVVKKEVESEQDVQRTLYKCERCALYFVGENCLFRHLNLNHKTHGERACDHCGLKFATFAIHRHIYLHHKKNRYQLDDFRVFIIDKQGQRSLIKNHALKSYNSPRTLDKFDHRKLYKCNICDLHFIHLEDLKRHSLLGRHSDDRGACTKCGIDFGVPSIDTHLKFHHGSLQLSLADFEIIDSSGGVKKPSSINSDSLAEESNDSAKSSTPRHHRQHESTDTKLDADIYKCKSCDICFLHIGTVQRHYKVKHELQVSVSACKHCGLRFSLVSLGKHVNLHHNRKNYTLEDFKIHEYDTEGLNISTKLADFNIGDCSSRDSDDVESLGRGSARVDTPSSIENKNPSPLFEDAGTSHQDTASDNAVELPPAVSDNTVDKRLYKCSDCPIHFMKRNTLQNHIYEDIHKQSQVVKCELCGFMFTPKSLKLHYEAHHETVKLTASDFTIIEMMSKKKASSGGKGKDASPEPEPSSSSDVLAGANEFEECSDDVTKHAGAVGKTAEADADKVQSRLVSTTTDERTCDETPLPTEDVTNKTASPTDVSLDRSKDMAPAAEEEPTDTRKEADEPADTSKESGKAVDNRGESEVIEVEDDDTVVHTCRFCGEVFKNNTAKEFHESLDHLDAVTECPICKESLNASILNELHLRIKDQRLTCCLCNKSIMLSSLKNHVLTHST